ISLVPTGEEHFVAKISEILCEGCGICVGTCPLNAIDLKHVKQEQINTQIRALLSMKETSKPLVLAICCSECGHAAVDSSSVARINYPASVRVMTVPCTGIIQVHNMLEAFKAGAQGVMIIGCKEDGCQYDMGSQIAKRKVEFAKLILKDIGIEPERLEMFNMIFAEGRKFAETAREMVNKIEKLGPIKLYEI
ncbi:TPA: hydrogenase iron-sulfur subunit, partial [Candidatus Bathyarchaeota archaeon]|nr:hydrogenase iron-sulfur subunit [Candidatus Bathyarchaeota archaeon]